MSAPRLIAVIECRVTVSSSLYPGSFQAAVVRRADVEYLLIFLPLTLLTPPQYSRRLRRFVAGYIGLLSIAVNLASWSFGSR